MILTKCHRCTHGCPHCSCGFVTTEISVNASYTRRCLNADCGESNGRQYAGPGLPALPLKPARCSFCGSDNIVWEKV